MSYKIINYAGVTMFNNQLFNTLDDAHAFLSSELSNDPEEMRYYDIITTNEENIHSLTAAANEK